MARGGFGARAREHLCRGSNSKDIVRGGKVCNDRVERRRIKGKKRIGEGLTSEKERGREEDSQSYS